MLCRRHGDAHIYTYLFPCASTSQHGIFPVSPEVTSILGFCTVHVNSTVSPPTSTPTPTGGASARSIRQYVHRSEKICNCINMQSVMGCDVRKGREGEGRNSGVLPTPIPDTLLRLFYPVGLHWFFSCNCVNGLTYVVTGRYGLGVVSDVTRGAAEWPRGRARRRK